jgi:Zn ribbon nucleic-acid-binding protein
LAIWHWRCAFLLHKTAQTDHEQGFREAAQKCTTTLGRWLRFRASANCPMVQKLHKSAQQHPAAGFVFALLQTAQWCKNCTKVHNNTRPPASFLRLCNLPNVHKAAQKCTTTPGRWLRFCACATCPMCTKLHNTAQQHPAAGFVFALVQPAQWCTLAHKTAQSPNAASLLHLETLPRESPTAKSWMLARPRRRAPPSRARIPKTFAIELSNYRTIGVAFSHDPAMIDYNG